MSTVKNKFLAAVYLIFAILLTWKTNYMFMAFLDVINDTFIKSLFWIGYVMLFATLVVLMPYRLSTAQADVDIYKAIGGIFWFISGYVTSIILSFIFIALPDELMAGEVGLIMWFGYYLIIVILTIVLPWYTTLPEGT